MQSGTDAVAFSTHVAVYARDSFGSLKADVDSLQVAPMQDQRGSRRDIELD
jgi:hypothetical protein